MPARLTLVLLIVALCCSGAAFAQETFTTVVRGDNVPLLKRPNPDSRKIAILRRGDGIRVTGPAKNPQGEEKPVTTESLGVTKRWFVPVEVIGTGELGWIAEVYVNPRAIAWETPSSVGTATVLVPSPLPVFIDTPTSVPTAMLEPAVTPAPTVTAAPFTRSPDPMPVPSPTLVQPKPVATTPTAVISIPLAATASAGAPTPALPTPAPVLREATYSDPVSAAKESNTASCSDGIGVTFSIDALTIAALNGEGDQFFEAHRACFGDSETGIALATYCSPSAVGGSPSITIMFCRLEIENDTSIEVPIELSQFAVANNKMIYPADTSAYKIEPDNFNMLATPANLSPGETLTAIVRFSIPRDLQNQDMIVVWTLPGVVASESSTEELRLTAIVDEREPSILEVMEAEPIEAIPSSTEINPTVEAIITERVTGLTLEESDYIEAVQPIVEAMGSSVNRFADLTDAPRIGDASWETDLQDEVDIWTEEYEELLAITPPATMQEIHDEYKEYLRLMVKFGTELMFAVRNLDSDAMDRAADLMNEATPHMKRAAELLQAFLAEKGFDTSGP